MKEVKPALSINNQIEHLTSAHGLIIDDVEKAHVILSRINYYRLSGYGIGLKRQDDREQYRPGISIDTLFRLYQFDSLFKNNLVHLIEQIEIRLRAQISNFLALKYGPLGYLNADNFCDHATKKMGSIHQAIIDSFNNEVDRQKNLPYVKHHVQEYGGQFPIWVAVELFSFGNRIQDVDIIVLFKFFYNTFATISRNYYQNAPAGSPAGFYHKEVLCPAGYALPDRLFVC